MREASQFLLRRRPNGILLSLLWRKTNENNASVSIAYTRRQTNQCMCVCVSVSLRAVRWCIVNIEHEQCYIRSMDGCQSWRRRSNRERTRNIKCIKSSEPNRIENSPLAFRMFCLFCRAPNVAMSLFVAFNVLTICIVWYTRRGRTGARHLHIHAYVRLLIFRCVTSKHTHIQAAAGERTYDDENDTHDGSNGGENIARATIRHEIFRLNLFKSIQIGQPNVAHAIHSLSL